MAASSSIGDAGTSVGSGLRDGLTNLGTGLGNGVSTGLTGLGDGVSKGLSSLALGVGVLGLCHVVAECIKSHNRDGGDKKAKEQKGGQEKGVVQRVQGAGSKPSKRLGSITRT